PSSSTSFPPRLDSTADWSWPAEPRKSKSRQGKLKIRGGWSCPISFILFIYFQLIIRVYFKTRNDTVDISGSAPASGAVRCASRRTFAAWGSHQTVGYIRAPV